MENILFSEFKIKDRIQQIAVDISRDYSIKETPLVIGVLKGSFMFTTDLIRHISIPVMIDFIEVKSYKGTESTGDPIITKQLTESVLGKNVILTDCIIDTGYTLDFLIKYLKSRGVKSISTAVLIDKGCKRKVPVKIDYKGFDLDNKFAVGYGTDYLQLYRNLPYIKELKT